MKQINLLLYPQLDAQLGESDFHRKDPAILATPPAMEDWVYRQIQYGTRQCSGNQLLSLISLLMNQMRTH